MHALAVLEIAELWADARTDATSPRRADLIRDKVHILLAFFEFVAKPPAAVQPQDIRRWQHDLERQGLAPQTVYGHISRVSSFYTWAMQEDRLAQVIKANPVRLARPKAPKPYQSTGTKALSTKELVALVTVVETRAQAGDMIAKRDYALLLFYVLSGMRRREIIQLQWGDIELQDDSSLVLTTQVKGGTYLTREIADPSVSTALLDYLQASDRWAGMQPTTPLWVAHDAAQTTKPGAARSVKQLGKQKVARHPGRPLTSHGFVKRLQQYAKQAGVKDMHLHRTRHSFAALVGESAESLTEVQEALNHRHSATTRVYLERITRKRDKHSRAIAQRLGIGHTTADRAAPTERE